MTAEMRLRLATIEDLPLLKAWDDEPDVLAASGADPDWDWDSELGRRVSWRETLLAEVAGRPIGVVEIIDPAEEETHYWGEIESGLLAIDIWIGDAADRGRGLGGEMMVLALDRCFAAESVGAVVIDPLATNVRACRFYERLGFRSVGPRRFFDDDCIVYRLERSAWLAGSSRLGRGEEASDGGGQLERPGLVTGDRPAS